jgi:RNA-directed DNA polymerase
MPIFPRYAGPPLMDQVVSVANLTNAWRRVRSNIQVARRNYSAGVDAVTLRDFEADWRNQMAQLADELRTGSYRPLPPKRVAIPKRSGGERAIAILAVRDRVAQRAVQQVLEPLFDPFFLDCSYGCRPRVGVPDAVARVTRYADQGLTWTVDADISGYFDRIDQRILLGLLRQRIDEPPLLQLIARWLQVGSLQQAESDPLGDPPTIAGSALLGHGSSWWQNLSADAPPVHVPGYVPAEHLGDPYGVAWEVGPAAPPPGTPAMPTGPLDQRIWTAIALARPAIDGARRALPHLQRIGVQRLAVAGAIAAGVVAAGELAVRATTQAARGTPQGGALSPLLANIYLHPFDLALTSQGLRLVRFVDDFVIMCADQPEAERALALVQRQLQTLRLELNQEKTRVVPYAEGIEFLGQALAPRPDGIRLIDGVQTFEEAEQALRRTSRQVREQFERGAAQVRRRFNKNDQ